MNKFVVIEGLDGVGKTTVSEGLRRHIVDRGASCVRLYGVPPPFDKIAAEIPNVANVYSRYHFYMASNISVSDQVRTALQHSHVILDRYAYSTYAYHFARGAEVAVPVFSRDGLLRPDLAVLLVVRDEEIRVERLRNRETLTRDDLERRSNGQFIEKLETAYKRLGLVEVDNSNADPLVSVQMIISLLFADD